MIVRQLGTYNLISFGIMEITDLYSLNKTDNVLLMDSEDGNPVYYLLIANILSSCGFLYFEYR